MVDRNPDTLSDTTGLLRSKGTRVSPYILDLTEFDRLDPVLEEISQAGMVDILVNNAGFDRAGAIPRVLREDFEAVLGIHVTAALLLIKHFLPAMRSAGWGRIVNVSSIYGVIGGKGQVAFSTAKAALLGLTKSVAREAGADGVTVNAVLPGLVRTPTIETFMAGRFKEAVIAETPLNRMAEPEEVARVIAFLASDEASFITSAAIPVSGGWGI